MLAADGTRVGEVTEVIHLPVQDTLVVRTTDGERLIPFVAALVPDLDLKAGTCTLADVRGLMDDEAEVAGPDAPVGGAAEVEA